MRRMPATVDRAFAKMVCFKRIVTGSLSIASGIVLIVALIEHGSAPPLAALALLILLGGGVWTLRDGLRLRRDLQQS